MKSENGYDEFRKRVAQLVGNEEPFVWAKRHGIPSATWDRLWNQSVIPKADTLLKIAKGGNVTVDWLLTGSDHSHTADGLRATLMALEAEAQRAVAPGAEILWRVVATIRFMLAEAEGEPISQDLREARNRALTAPLMPSQPSVQVNTDALAGSLAAVEELLMERRLTLSPDKKAKLVTLVYNQLTKSSGGGQIERGLVSDLLDLAS